LPRMRPAIPLASLAGRRWVVWCVHLNRTLWNTTSRRGNCHCKFIIDSDLTNRSKTVR
jgi:hypothetical protein